MAGCMSIVFLSRLFSSANAANGRSVAPNVHDLRPPGQLCCVYCSMMRAQHLKMVRRCCNILDGNISAAIQVRCCAGNCTLQAPGCKLHEQQLTQRARAAGRSTGAIISLCSSQSGLPRLGEAAFLGCGPCHAWYSRPCLPWQRQR